MKMILSMRPFLYCRIIANTLRAFIFDQPPRMLTIYASFILFQHFGHIIIYLRTTSSPRFVFLTTSIIFRAGLPAMYMQRLPRL